MAWWWWCVVSTMLSLPLLLPQRGIHFAQLHLTLFYSGNGLTVMLFVRRNWMRRHIHYHCDVMLHAACLYFVLFTFSHLTLCSLLSHHRKSHHTGYELTLDNLCTAQVTTQQSCRDVRRLSVVGRFTYVCMSFYKHTYCATLFFFFAITIGWVP